MTRIAAIGLVLTTAMLVGCGNSHTPRTKDDKLALNPAVTDIAPVSAPIAPTPAPAPAVQPQPVVYDPVQADPAAEDVAAPAPAPARSKSTRSTAGGTKYKVKKGDTLWKIAEVHYGSGAKWQRIASANPKIDPDHVMAGQTIVIP